MSKLGIHRLPLSPGADHATVQGPVTRPFGMTGGEPDVNAPYGLTDRERIWAKLQPFFARKGYMLGPRYLPGWIGSWVGTGRAPETCDDTQATWHPGKMHAVRIADGMQVMLKLYSATMNSSELTILQYFSSETLAPDPRNHCVPLLESFPLEPVPGKFSGDTQIIVEPLFRTWRSPAFKMVVEGLSFVKQLLEGLAFMHSHNVAHRDIAYRNILMDARQLYPDGFHGFYNILPGKFAEKGVRKRTRLEVPVRYYYIDFGLSTKFPSFEERPLVTWVAGFHEDLPELAEDRTAPYDAFKADVHALGFMIEEYLFRCRTGFEFLRPLVSAMVQADPDDRPTAAACLRLFEGLTCNLSRLDLLKPLGWAFRLDWEDWGNEIAGYVKELYQAIVYGLGREF